MGLFDGGLFGVDMNLDGKKDLLDDMLFMGLMEEEEKRRKKEAGQTDEDDD